MAVIEETFGEEPRWMTLVNRLRIVAETHGFDTEVGWLAHLAADQITADNQIIDQQRGNG